MKQESFSRGDKLKAIAVVHVFETGKPFGDPAACVVLDDGAGVSYGINQFTHRSGSLLAVVEKYLESGGVVGCDVIADRLPALKRPTASSIAKLAGDTRFKNALKAAATTREMRTAQEDVALEKYLAPAIDECGSLEFVLPLSLAVVYDSIVHGSWERIRDRVGGGTAGVEKRWIEKYVETRAAWLKGISRLRKTAYRTDFFLGEIARGNWTLRLPMNVHGVRLTSAMFRDLDREPAGPVQQMLPFESDRISASNPSVTTDGSDTKKVLPVGPGQNSTTRPPAHAGGSDLNSPPNSSDPGRIAPAEQAQPAKREEETGRRGDEGTSRLDKVENGVDSVAAKYDQVERIARTATTRADSAKSLWTTVVGTFWQMVWAVGGFAAGVPREVWLVVAVIAGLLMLVYLYRQIEMGRIRERSGA